jgi:flagellar biosynthesis protein FlhA
VELARGIAPPGRVLIIADDLGIFAGEEVVEPVFGLPAKWIPEAQRTEAEALGATVVDRASVVTTHLAEVARDHAADLICRQDVKNLLDLVRESDPAVIDDLGASDVSLPQVQWVLQELLKEQVPIRDVVRILEVIGEKARYAQTGEDLVEAVREVLAPAITERHARNHSLAVIGLDPVLEQELTRAFGADPGSTRLDAAQLQAVVDHMIELVRRAENDGHEPVVLCSPMLRRSLRRLVEGIDGSPPVLSFREVGPQVDVLTVGTVSHPTSLVGTPGGIVQ